MIARSTKSFGQACLTNFITLDYHQLYIFFSYAKCFSLFSFYSVLNYLIDSCTSVTRHKPEKYFKSQFKRIICQKKLLLICWTHLGCSKNIYEIVFWVKLFFRFTSLEFFIWNLYPKIKTFDKSQHFLSKVRKKNFLLQNKLFHFCQNQPIGL